jgi:crotonobetainyl-CoA:carnitine CoA-transferase CaiB-like acyl-CoA transferase
MPDPGRAATPPPLAGITVVEACNFIAGPFASLMLSDLGADVIKVEPPPKGDPYRWYAPVHEDLGLAAAAVNRGKRSVFLDLKTPPGRDRFESLVRDADVFIENWRPGVADRLGVSDDVLRHLNPGLVHVSITAYGESGPHAQRGGFDTIIQAESGVAGLGPDLSSRPMPSYLADKATGTLAAQAALAALVERQATGKGSVVAISLLDSLAYFNFPDMFSEYLIAGRPPSAPPRAFSASFLETADGFVAVAPATGAQVRAVLEAVGHPEWHEQLRRLGPGDEFLAELHRRVESETRKLSTGDAVDLFSSLDVPTAPVVDVPGHLDHPQIRHNGTYQVAEDAELGAYRFARHPARFHGEPLDCPAGLPSRNTTIGS